MVRFSVIIPLYNKAPYVAKAIGSGQSSVSRFEAGILRPKPEIAQRLGKVLDFDWKEIYEEDIDGEAEAAGTLG